MKNINQKIELVDVDKLSMHPANAKKGNMHAIGQSIEKNGFYGVIVAQVSTGHILAGNHRYLGAKEAGAKEIQVAWVDVDDAEAKRIMVADNRTSDLGTYDDGALAELLKDLAADGMLSGTGYTAEDADLLIDGIKSVTDDDWSAAFGGLPTGDKAPIQTMTFTLHDAQAETVKAAVDRARERIDKTEETGNKNRNGNALAIICSAYLRATGDSNG